MSQLYIHENLVRIQPLVHKILGRQESVTSTLMPTGSAPKQYVFLLAGGGGGGRGSGLEITTFYMPLDFLTKRNDFYVFVDR